MFTEESVVKMVKEFFKSVMYCSLGAYSIQTNNQIFPLNNITIDKSNNEKFQANFLTFLN